MSGPIRDKDLLDALEGLERVPHTGTVWRSVREGRNADDCWRAGGRWDDRSFDVLYLSMSPQGAVEERRFHLFRGQPFPPSKVHYELFELRVRISAVVAFRDLGALQTVGMNTRQFGMASYVDKDSEYPRSQEIAEACFFLGADGIIVPSARHESHNLVAFCDQNPRPEFEIVRSLGTIDWTTGEAER